MDLFQFLGFHKNFLLANSTQELSKVLESLNFLRKSEGMEAIVSNRFGMVLEEEKIHGDESSGEKILPFDEETITPRQTTFTQKSKTTTQFATIPEFEDVPSMEEIKTEPFSQVEEENFDFTIPFFSKSNENTKEIPESILEKAFLSKE
ncbi:MAG: hypothetical protein N3A69_18535, partial [Leptospiraceae bacterium]|nr:hypothetical protein [Leptospiraceae bacterium]